MKIKTFFGLLALLVGFVLCSEGLWLLVRPAEYQASVKIKINPDYMPNPNGFVSYATYFVETEFKVMQGELVLSNAVQALSLDAKWAKHYGHGEKLETEKAINLLRRRISFVTIWNTRLVEIRVCDYDPNEAARIANAIADAYWKYRLDQHRLQIRAGIKLLEAQYQEEETNIFLMQSNVDRLRAPYRNNETDYSSEPSPIITPEVLQEFGAKLTNEEATLTKLANQYTEFRAIQATNPIALAKVLLAINSDLTLSNLLDRLHGNEQKLVVEPHSVGTNSPDRAATLGAIDVLKSEISERVTEMIFGLKVAIRAEKDKVDTISNKLDQLKMQMQEKVVREQAYWEAKRVLVDKMELHQTMGTKIAQIKADAAASASSLATVVAPAVPPKHPIGLNRWWGGAFLICGLAIASFGYISCVREMREFKPRREQ